MFMDGSIPSRCVSNHLRFMLAAMCSVWFIHCNHNQWINKFVEIEYLFYSGTFDNRHLLLTDTILNYVDKASIYFTIH